MKHLKSLILFIITILSTTAALAQQGVCCPTPGWQYVAPIQVSNTSGSAYANYQVVIVYNTQTPIAAGRMRADGGDIRFTDGTCNNFLPYWIEGGLNTPFTLIWVRVPALPVAGTTLYMYYGNPGAAPASNFPAVFPNVYTLNTTINSSTTISADWIDIQAGGVINVQPGQPLTLQARRIIMNGTINGNSMGNGPAAGPGAGGSGGGGVGGGGGGHGGPGGSGGSGNGGVTYGTPTGADFNLGSGGGGSDCGPTAAGGGAVRMIGAAIIDVNGTINMDGQAAATCCCGANSEAAGGGSGGAILLEGEFIRGAGTLNANGGNGGNSDNKEGGGGGGGGRVKRRFVVQDQYTGPIAVNGAAPGTGGQSGMQPGLAGTNTSSQIGGIFTTPQPEIIIPIPAPAFTFAAACINSPSQFTNTTPTNVTVTGWAWNFGDGNTSSAQNPTNTYTGPGPYNVTLVATSNAGCTAQTNNQVSPNPAPTAVITAPANGACVNTPVNFSSANSTIPNGFTITGWAWDFGDGNTSTQQNPTHTYTTANSYTVTLTVTSNTSCTHTVTQNFTVNSAPVPNFTTNTACQGANTNFTNTTPGNNQYSWAFGDGNTSTATNPSHLYANAGVFFATLTATSQAQCVGAFTDTVFVLPKPLASFSVTDVCLSNPSVFTDLSSVQFPAVITNWAWNFGSSGGTSTLQNPTFTYNNPSIFNVTLTVTSTGGCTDDTTLQHEVFPGAVVGFTAPTVCQNAPVAFINNTNPANVTNWAWNFGDASPIDTNQTPTHTYTNFGSFDVVLQATTNNGCVSSDTVTLTINDAPTASFTAIDVCLGQPTPFQNTSTGVPSSIVSFDWRFGDSSFSLAPSPNYTYLAPGTYSVQLVVANINSCKDTVVQDITVAPLPTVSITATPQSGCVPLTVEFTATANVDTPYTVTQYNWDFGDGTGSGQTVSNTYTSPGDYDVQITVTSNAGCKTVLTETDFVTASPLPTASFYPTPPKAEVVGSGILFNNTSTGDVAWLWDFAGLGSSIEIEPTFIFPDTGVYEVELLITNSFGCVDSTTRTVTITPSVNLYVPNAFTPTEDAINDKFLVKGEGLTSYQLTILDRWGSPLFVSKDMNEGWDGKFPGTGEYCPNGVYVWVLTYTTFKSKERRDVGKVTLIR